MYKKIFYPPDNISVRDIGRKSIFLGGSIDMGKAKNWQPEMEIFFTHIMNFTVFNPRRLDWDNTIEQRYHDARFFQQVAWELNALEKADYILIFFDGKSSSPISLLELGLYVDSGKLFVVCEEDFYRFGNIEVVCAIKNIPLFKNLDDFTNSFEFNYKHGVQ
jgi:Nucleoside 2-deoxyribosyltransferase like